MISIAELIRYRRQNEKLVKRVAEARIPTEWGDFTCYVYESLLDGEQHVAMVRGAVQGEDERARPGALRVPHRRRLRLAALRLRRPARRGHEAHRRRGPRRARLPPGPRGSRHRHRPQDPGLLACRTRATTPSTPTSALGLPIDSREYGIGAQILVDLGITTMRLHDQQPGQVRRPRGLRPRDHRAGAAASRLRTPRTSTTCAPSATRWATCSRASTTDVRATSVPPTRCTGERRRLRRARRRRVRSVQRPHHHPPARGRRQRGSPCTAWPRPTSPIVWVPGAFEIPLAAKSLIVNGRVDAVDLPRRGDPGRDLATTTSWRGSAPGASRTCSSRPACR